MLMNRREMILRTAAAAAGLVVSGCVGPRDEAGKAPKKILFFSKSSTFEHSVIKRKGSELSFVEKILADLGPQHGIDFAFSKDGSLFSPEYLAPFDAFCFYTDGDLTLSGVDKNPAMTAAGKGAFLDAVERGKGFIGIHSASASFPTKEPVEATTANRPRSYQNYGPKADPYVRMLGAQFLTHSPPQIATARLVDGKFPGMVQHDISLLEEWYSLGDFSDDLHVLLALETQGMSGTPYRRPPYPCAWARRHGRGRVFYNALGHQEGTWTNPLFQQMLFGGIAWAVGNVNADIRPNIQAVTPGFATLPPRR